MVATVTLETFSDADFVRRCLYLADSIPVDLTGSVLKMDVRKFADSPTSFITITSAEAYSVLHGGIRITDHEAADFIVHLPRLQLERMPPGEYVHSLIRVRPDGIYEAVWEGTLNHIAGPSR